jgi:hypothetical protein
MLQTIRPGLRVLGTKDKMPRLPEIEYVLKTKASDARPAVSALGNLVQGMATEVIPIAKKKIRGQHQSLWRRVS